MSNKTLRPRDFSFSTSSTYTSFPDPVRPPPPKLSCPSCFSSSHSDHDDDEELGLHPCSSAVPSSNSFSRLVHLFGETPLPYFFLLLMCGSIVSILYYRADNSLLAPSSTSVTVPSSWLPSNSTKSSKMDRYYEVEHEIARLNTPWTPIDSAAIPRPTVVGKVAEETKKSKVVEQAEGVIETEGGVSASAGEITPTVFAVPPKRNPIAKSTMSWGSGYILYNAKVHTSDEERPLANAIAVAAGRFLGVGNVDTLRADFPHLPAHDMHGRTIIPGLIDSHAHLLALGSQEAGLDLTGIKTLEETLQRCKAYADAKNLPSGEWLQGNGWDESLWPGQQFPTRYDLDEVFPDRPVVLERVDGHSIWANSKAIEIAEKENGPLPQTVDGGAIMRDKNGVPTGIFSDSASDLIYDVVTGGDDDGVSSREAMKIALRDAVKHGLTGVHDASMPASSVDLVKSMIDQNEFDLRVYAMLGSWDSESLRRYCPYAETNPHSPYGSGWGTPIKSQVYGYGDGKLTVRSVKVFMDGALGSRGAALLEPYTDDPTTSGSLSHTKEELESIVRHWIGCGYQVNTHAIGDRANRYVLDVYEKVLAHEPVPARRRLRIEHAQILTEEDIPRFHKLGVLPSMQPTHATSDMTFAELRLGKERVKYGYAWRSLLNTSSSMVIPFGSDFPFAGFVNPFWGLYSAVTRQNEEGQPADGWYGEQCLSRVEALRGFTLHGAYASFQEHDIGSISPGKRADFVVIRTSVDPFSDKSSPLFLRHAQVLATFLGGKPSYCFNTNDYNSTRPGVVPGSHDVVENEEWLKANLRAYNEETKRDEWVRGHLPGCNDYLERNE